MDCLRKRIWKNKEIHACFINGCLAGVDPSCNKTCPSCNWKYCNNGHCGCDTSEETRDILSKFYDLFCKPHNYSNETKYALKIMLETFVNNCMEYLE